MSKELNLPEDEENVKRYIGRLNNAPMNYGTKYRIILRKVSKFTELNVDQS